MRPGPIHIKRLTAIVLGAILVLFYCGVQLTPKIIPVNYLIESKPDDPAHDFTLPLVYHVEHTTALVTVQIVNNAIYPTHYEFFADDCINTIWVNGAPISSTEPLFCDFQFGQTFDLSQFLRADINKIEVRVRNWGGRGDFNLKVSRQDPQTLLVRILCLAVFVWYAFSLIQQYAANSQNYTLYIIFLCGALLRLVYVVATPFGVRSHDVVGHIEYIKYVHEMGTLPQFNTSWTFHHPPLYYRISVVWLKLGEILQFPAQSLLYFLQYESLLFSIVTLGIGCWIVALSFRDPKQHIERFTFASLIAVFPGMVFFSARINNDALFQVLAFLIVALLIRWWKSREQKDWIILSVVLGIGLLTKATTLLLTAWVYLLLLVRLKGDLSQIIRRLAESLVIVAFIAGWFFFSRYIIQGQHSIDPTFVTSNKSLIIENTLVNFLTFNPIKVLEFTYNNPWADLERRMFFWEYLYRSAFLGEFIFGNHLFWISSYLLLLGLQLLPLLIYGITKEPYRKGTIGVPMATLLLMSIAALISLRLEYPAASAQDFRFIFYSLIPCGYFLARAIEQIKGPWKTTILTFLGSFIAGAIVFVLLLYCYRTPNKFELEDLGQYHSWKKATLGPS